LEVSLFKYLKHEYGIISVKEEISQFKRWILKDVSANDLLQAMKKKTGVEDLEEYLKASSFLFNILHHPELKENFAGWKELQIRLNMDRVRALRKSNHIEAALKLSKDLVGVRSFTVELAKCFRHQSKYRHAVNILKTIQTDEYQTFSPKNVALFLSSTLILDPAIAR